MYPGSVVNSEVGAALTFELPQRMYRDTFGFLLANLQIAKLTFDHIVEMTTYHVELRKHLNAFVKVKDEFIFEPFPAWTAIGIHELITEGTLVEIRAIAQRFPKSE